MMAAPSESSDEEVEEYSDQEEVTDDEEQEQQGAQRFHQPRQEAIYNREELHEKLEDIMWEGASFRDTQTVTCNAESTIDDIDDDLQRELCFYNQALSGARQAISSFESAGQHWMRPPDYYAEMVKSDGHMAKIKEQLMFEQRRIEEADERRKQREAKRTGKEVQAQREREKAQARKANISRVDQLRRQRKRSGFAGELDMEAELGALDGHGARPGGQRISPGQNKTSKKRDAKNSRYGFGGRKRLQKQNDASSAADMNGYRGRGKGGPSRRGRGRGGGAGVARGRGQQRPGKSRRMAARGK